jgi:hypothetical protein
VLLGLVDDSISKDRLLLAALLYGDGNIEGDAILLVTPLSEVWDEKFELYILFRMAGHRCALRRLRLVVEINARCPMA